MTRLKVTHLDGSDHEGGAVCVWSGVTAGQHPGAHVPQDKILVRKRTPVNRNPTRAVVSLRCWERRERQQ